MDKEVNVFVVVKKGVYCQGIVGVFDKLEKAILEAQLFEKAQYDDYHDFEVIETILNKANEVNREYGGNENPKCIVKHTVFGTEKKKRE